MRIQVKVKLPAWTGLEDGEPSLRYFVWASARVQINSGTLTHSDESVIEDIEVDEVICHWLGYGDLPAHACFTGGDPVDRGANREARDWLNSRMDDRDDWRGIIEAAYQNHSPRELAAAS